MLRGPGNWQLALQAPADRGILCGVEDSRSPELQDVEALIYALAFAATAMDRGSARVGIATNGSLARLSRHDARRKIERLAYAVAMAGSGPVADVAGVLVPTPSISRRYPMVRMFTIAYREARAALGMELPGPVAEAAPTAKIAAERDAAELREARLAKERAKQEAAEGKEPIPAERPKQEATERTAPGAAERTGAGSGLKPPVARLLGRFWT